jgi:hypothetical protein
MRLKRGHLFMGVVIEHAQLKVIRTRDKPVLASYEFDTTHRNLCNFECFDNGASFMVVDVDRAIIEA